jgi:hypothetical protein
MPSGPHAVSSGLVELTEYAVIAKEGRHTNAPSAGTHCTATTTGISYHDETVIPRESGFAGRTTTRCVAVVVK